MIALPGFGGSDEPAGDWGSWDYADLLHRWITAQNRGAPDIIAHSFGGRIALALASRYPETTGRMVLIGCAGLIPPKSFSTRIKLALSKVSARFARTVGGKIGQWIFDRRQRLGSTDWQNSTPIMRSVMRNILKEDLSDRLPSILQPVRLIWGEQDTATPPILAQRMIQLLPSARLTMIPGTGHFPFLDKKGEVLSAVWDHLGIKEVW